MKDDKKVDMPKVDKVSPTKEADKHAPDVSAAQDPQTAKVVDESGKPVVVQPQVPEGSKQGNVHKIMPDKPVS